MPAAAPAVLARSCCCLLCLMCLLCMFKLLLLAVPNVPAVHVQVAGQVTIRCLLCCLLPAACQAVMRCGCACLPCCCFALAPCSLLPACCACLPTPVKCSRFKPVLERGPIATLVAGLTGPHFSLTSHSLLVRRASLEPDCPRLKYFPPSHTAFSAFPCGAAGGIWQMHKMAAMAEAHHIQMAPHSGSLGPVRSQNERCRAPIQSESLSVAGVVAALKRRSNPV